MGIENKFRFETRITPDEAQLAIALQGVQESYEKMAGNDPAWDAKTILEGIYQIDTMGRATIGNLPKVWRAIGKAPEIVNAVETRLDNFDSADLSEDALRTIRVAHLLGYTKERRLATLWSKFGRTTAVPTSTERYVELYEKHFGIIDKKRQEEEAKIQAEQAKVAKQKDREQRLTETAWRPAETNTGKTPEWLTIQREARQKWTDLLAANKITNGTSFAADLIRFQALMDLLHEEIAQTGKTTVDITKRCRAIAEALYQNVWGAPDQVEEFFNDIDQISYTSPTQTVSDLSPIARAFYIRANMRNSNASLTDVDTKKQIKRTFNLLSQVFHPDRNNPDTNPDLSEYAYPFMGCIQKAVIKHHREK